MGLLAWVMMGLAIWHFTIFLPDRFWGGIVGAFVGSLVGAIVVGLLIYCVKVSSLKIPGENATDVVDRALRDPGRADRHGARLPRGHAARTKRRTPAPTKPEPRRVPSRPGRNVAAMPATRFQIADCPPGQVARLRRELGVSGALAQVLVRRGLGDPTGARAFLDAAEEHPPSDFAGIEKAVEPILAHVSARGRITIHGDYDVDGICSTAILVSALRSLGADVDSYLPDRIGDGYGLSAATVRRLAERGTELLVTADCAITAVEEVALAVELGMQVVVSDHHAARADGRLPDAPLVHPALCGYPCPELCATAVAYKLAQAVFTAAGRDPVELRARPRARRAGDGRRRGAADRREPHAGAPRPARAGEHAAAGPARADGGRARRPRVASTSVRSASRWRRD